MTVLPEPHAQIIDAVTARAIIGALAQPALLISASERVEIANSRAAELFGLAPEGRPFVTLIRQPDALEAIDSAQRRSSPATGRYMGAGPGASVYELTAMPLDLASRAPGAAAGRVPVLLTFADVGQLESAGRMRRDFVANVSHELRTPLTALLGFIETLRGPARDDSAARERFLSIMQTEAARMNRLVLDLLSLNRVESEERVRPSARVELVALLAKVAALLEPVAREAGVRIALRTETDTAAVLGDADQLTQVFQNLVENAVKYGRPETEEEAVVTIGLRPVAHEPLLRRPCVEVSVIDRGPGIDPHHVPRLTERFYRVDSHRSRAVGGTGLGLAIVKHIVNRHRGRLKISSRPGEGSTFAVYLPLD